MELNKVIRVYSGKPGCMCGCNGQYKRSSAHAGTADTNEISDRSVKIIFNKIIKNPLHKFDAKANCIYVTTETRQLVAYFA